MNNKLIKVNNKKGDSFKGKFYIVDKTTDDRGEWWVLRLRHNHFTLIAVESKDKLFECLHKIIIKRKNYDRLLKVLKRCERELHSKEDYEKMVEDYHMFKEGSLYTELEEFITEEENKLSGKDKKKKVVDKSIKDKYLKKEVPVNKKLDKKINTNTIIKKKKKTKKIHILK